MCIFIFTHIDEAARGIGQCLAKDLPQLAESCGKDIVSCTRHTSSDFTAVVPGRRTLAS